MSSASERAARRRATWTGGVVRSFAEADQADLEFWRAATPEERIRGVTDLIEEMRGLAGESGPPPDFRDLLEEFAQGGVECVLVGGYAVAFHGRPRATKDIDLVLEGSAENLARASDALARFGAPANVVAATAKLSESDVVFLGQPPLRIDMMRRIDGVEAGALFAEATKVVLDGVPLRVISLAHLIANKRAAGRPQDVVDADYLEALGSSRR